MPDGPQKFYNLQIIKLHNTIKIIKLHNTIKIIKLHNL